jgi:hypothetical protein
MNEQSETEQSELPKNIGGYGVGSFGAGGYGTGESSGSTYPGNDDGDTDAPSKVESAQSWLFRANPVSDLSTPTDKLGFQPYVEAIAAFLTDADTAPPLTLSVEGEWGTGKTSFMKQLERELREPSHNAKDGSVKLGERLRLVFQLKKRPKQLTFWFNAWRHEKQEAMWATFALCLTKKIREEQAWPRRIWGDFRLGMSRVKTFTKLLKLILILSVWALLFFASLGLVVYIFNLSGSQRATFVSQIRSLVTSSGGSLRSILSGGKSTLSPYIAMMSSVHAWFAALFVLGSLWLWLSKIVGKRLEVKLERYLDRPDYEHRSSFIETFHEDFSCLVKAYAGRRKVFVFVDDLDRCDVPRAADLMQAINLMIGDDPHLVFILGMDREKIAAGITLKYKDLITLLKDPVRADAPVSARHLAAFGYTYLEKFIQLTFRVPRPGRDGLDLFLSSLSRVQTETATAAEERWSERAMRAARREKVQVKSRVDSEQVSELVKLVAPVLEWNPRRMKQFINGFRLNAYIASDLGLLDVFTEVSGEKAAQLTLQQLGKFVAIAMTWPDLLMDLVSYPLLLSRFYTNENNKKMAMMPDEQLLLDRWAREALLTSLLKAGCDRSDGRDYSLEGVDLTVLLNISPKDNRAPYPAGSQNGETPNATPGIDPREPELDMAQV